MVSFEQKGYNRNAFRQTTPAPSVDHPLPLPHPPSDQIYQISTHYFTVVIRLHFLMQNNHVVPSIELVPTISPWLSGFTFWYRITMLCCPQNLFLWVANIKTSTIISPFLPKFQSLFGHLPAEYPINENLDAYQCTLILLLTGDRLSRILPKFQSLLGHLPMECPIRWRTSPIALDRYALPTSKLRPLFHRG